MNASQLGPAARDLKALIAQVPLGEQEQQQAEALVRQCSEAELAALGLAPPAKPSIPKGMEKLPVRQRLQAVQRVINSLQYNHMPGYHYNVSKSRAFSRIMDTARDTLRAGLPIKCLEAAFLGALLTGGWADLDRLAMAFKSTVKGETYRHIVLAVHHIPSGKWGSLGISRRAELMDKDITFDSLADLVYEFKCCYERWWHTVVKVYVGLPLEHDLYYSGPVCWRYLTLSVSKHDWRVHKAALDAFQGKMRRLAAQFRSLGTKPVTGASLTEDQQQQGAAGAGTEAAAAPPRCAKSVSPSRRRASNAAPTGSARPGGRLASSRPGAVAASPPRGRPPAAAPHPSAAGAAAGARPRPGQQHRPRRNSDPSGAGKRGAAAAGRRSAKAQARAAVQQLKAQEDSPGAEAGAAHQAVDAVHARDVAAAVVASSPAGAGRLGGGGEAHGSSSSSSDSDSGDEQYEEPVCSETDELAL